MVVVLCMRVFFACVVVRGGLREHAPELRQKPSRSRQNLAVHDERTGQPSQPRGELNQAQARLHGARVHEGHHQTLFAPDRLVARKLLRVKLSQKVVQRENAGSRRVR